MSECDRESSIMRRPWPTGGCSALVKKMILPREQGKVFSASYISFYFILSHLLSYVQVLSPAYCLVSGHVHCHRKQQITPWLYTIIFTFSTVN